MASLSDRSRARPGEREYVLNADGNAIAIAQSQGRLAQRGRELAQLVAAVETAHALGEALRAVELAQVTCAVAANRPTDILTAPAIERVLNEIGRAYVPSRGPGRPRGPVRRVLHVITEGYATGGHTRVLERWLQRDERRTATVVVTGGKQLPRRTLAAINSSDSRIVPVLPGATLLDRAVALRDLATEHDLVVLHVHMHDVLPSLAFADPRNRPPVVLFEHAAHQFWLGTATTDLLASMRTAERRTAVARRGFPAERICRLPLPIAARGLPPREASRQALGLPLDRPIVLTVASQWKVMPGINPTMADLSESVLDAVPDAIHVVVGSAPELSWQRVLDRHPTRVLHPGPIPELRPLFAAADVYLDSWPISGGTTVLDVASARLPIVSLAASVPDFGMLCSVEDLGDATVVADSVSGVGDAVAALIADPVRSMQLGDLLADRVNRDHGDGWTAHLETLVARATELAGAATVLDPPQTAPPGIWEAVIDLQMGTCETREPVDAAHATARALRATTLPSDAVEFAFAFNRLTTPTGAPDRRRAVAAPPVAETAVMALVDRLRTLRADDAVTDCVVAIPEAQLDRALTLLQAALDAGTDVDVDVVVADAVEQVEEDGDLVLTWDASDRAWKQA
jgi:hypothetical protein